MKLAIMQPYFMPYLGYFSLINEVDEFIIFDTAQFIRHGWIERNNILKPNGEPLYIKVPLQKHARNTPICDVLIKNSENWKNKIISQLAPYKKAAPNYRIVFSLIEEIFNCEYVTIVELNYKVLKIICQYLEIKTPIKIWSEMNIAIEEVKSPDEWALNICKALNVDKYFNAIGGMSFFDKTKFLKSDIELKFLEFEPIEYMQFTNSFVPFLSIIDIMMFCDLKEIKKMLENVNYH